MGYLIDPAQALALMRESEKHGGHPCTRHIGISNEQLMQRLYNGEGGKNGAIQYLSTFTNESDAAKAASQTFKNISKNILAELDNRRDSTASFDNIRIDQAFKVRFALGSGVRLYYCNHMSIVLFKKPGQNSNIFYVKTFYPRPPNELRE
jgi:hypothetical protein